MLCVGLYVDHVGMGWREMATAAVVVCEKSLLSLDSECFPLFTVKFSSKSY